MGDFLYFELHHKSLGNGLQFNLDLMGLFNKNLGVLYFVIIFLGAGALQAEIRGKSSNKVYLKGTFDRNLTLKSNQ